MFIDPALFRDEAISDETRTFNAQLQQMLGALPKTSDLTPGEIRAERRSGTSLWGPIIHSENAVDEVIAGPGGELTLRIIDTEEPSGVYVHIHGGGWVLGAADLSDQANEAMVRNTGLAAVSVDYRLAPEHPYPAAVEDCTAAAEWVIEHAQERFGTDTIVIGGESAGANLAAATLLRTKEAGYTGWSAANLVYGSYFPHGSPSVALWSTDGLVLDSDTMTWFRDHYESDPPPEIDDPHYSPMYGDLRDLPPALFTVGTLDPLLDDSLFMAVRWLVAGNDTDLEVYPGGIHGFDAFPTTIGLAARERMYEFLRSVIG